MFKQLIQDLLNIKTIQTLIAPYYIMHWITTTIPTLPRYSSTVHRLMSMHLQVLRRHCAPVPDTPGSMQGRLPVRAQHCLQTATTQVRHLPEQGGWSHSQVSVYSYIWHTCRLL